jgi:hypothetical protein
VTARDESEEDDTGAVSKETVDSNGDVVRAAASEGPVVVEGLETAPEVAVVLTGEAVDSSS